MPDWSTPYLLSEWTIRLIMLFYVPQRRPAAAARTWLLLIFLLPWPGLAAYALFGRIRIPRKRIGNQLIASQRIIQGQVQLSGPPCTPELPPHFSPIPELAAKLGDFHAVAGNSVELIPGYEPALARLIADIHAATDHVHLLTYILAPDDVGRRVVAALRAAAARRVQCRVMLDAVGSRAGLDHFRRELESAGIEVIAMLKVGLFRRNAARLDLRNHRKIAVIDGRIGYVGSQNITDPYFVPGHPNEELVARITGPAVEQLQAVILADRFIETDERFDFTPLFPALPGTGHTPAQLLPSGPGYQRENAEELIIALLYAARERVVITTPYFVPDEPFLTALRSTVRRGVDVRLIASLHANQPFTQLAQRSYYDDLLAAGVHIHLYRPRFLHAKHLSVDGSIALVGSTNIDIRSFALNAEVSFIIYDPAVVAQLRVIQERYLADSEELNLEQWRKRSIPQRLAQNIARLADSLL